MYICLCKGITEQQLIEEVNRSKNASIKEISRRLGLGSDCGICLQESIKVIRSHSNNQSNYSDSKPTNKKS